MTKNKNKDDKGYIFKNPKKSKFKAVIFNGNTEPKIYNIPKGTNRTFNITGKTYNLSFEDTAFIKINGIFSSKFYLLYHINNPDPLKLIDKDLKPKHINSEVYNSVIETRVIQMANAYATKKDYSELFTPKNVVIALLVIGVLWYVLTGGTLK